MIQSWYRVIVFRFKPRFDNTITRCITVLQKVVKQYIIVRDNMPKTIVSVSKKHNSVWRMYYYDIDDNDDTQKFYAEKINPLLVWYYKLRKKKKCNNICDICSKEFRFWKSRFDKMPDECFECNPDEY